MVRSAQRAAFLREWGVELVRGNLSKPETLPPALEGVDAVIDASTARPSESVIDVDWHGKVNLIKACRDAGIQRFVFSPFSMPKNFPMCP